MELKHIGRYDIKSLIGQGGMSAVYLGYDPRALREVAIKVLPPYFLHAPKFRERFEREALTIALLEHPAIVPVYDMGEEDGQPYIVMRYMSGGSLAEKLKQGPISIRECVDMYLRLAPALDTAHARGVIHRDVKPDNLLFDKYSNVFLSDFGLARLRETLGFANISDGSILGTPAYMSPEQIQGDQEIDGRTDIYSMGVVLYHMLCGSVPFNGTTAASVMMMHLINPVPQISEKNSALPPSIQAVLDTAMAKNPNDRYQTAGEFAKALQSVITGAYRKPAVEQVMASSSPSIAAPSEPVARPGQAPVGQIPVQEQADKIIAAPVPSTQALPQRDGSAIATSATRPDSSAHLPRLIPRWVWWFGVGFVLLLALIVIQWLRDGFPFSLLAPGGNNPTSSLFQNTPSVAPGGADKLAFLVSSNIWVSNLDGSDLVQLTTDGVTRSNLHWTPDGQSLVFTSQNCLILVGLQAKTLQTLACFSGLDSISAFDLSPDGVNVAIGLNQTDLYLISYAQLFRLPGTSLPGDLAALSTCSYFAPYMLAGAARYVSWLPSGSRLAVVQSRLTAGVMRDQLSLIDFSRCTAAPDLLGEILPSYFLFTLRGYYDAPEIPGFSVNGDGLYLFTGDWQNTGLGNLLLYDLDHHDGHELSPNGSCCYGDARWSPDGSYIFYAYQPESGGQVSLYYVPYSEMDQAGSPALALSLPAGFLTQAPGSLQPALRKAP